MKNLLIIILFPLFIISCGESVKKTENQNIEIAKKVFEHFNKHEWGPMASLYQDTADFKDPSLGQSIVKQSRKQTIEKYSGMAEMFPDIKDEVINIYPSGDKNVIVEFISSGTAPDGTKWTLPICSIFTIENGLISKDFTYYDNAQ